MVDSDVHEQAVFVKIDEYKEVIDLFEKLRTKLAQAKDTLNKIVELKKEEQTEIDLWNNSIKEIEKKLHFIDQTLGETEN
ncbi:hypothetical protein JXB31_02290 [Candidatus Woesearchaeota archaeon]|nr:hypothetical protein [Candidatus Woesearchaeota archaeon]